MEILLTEHLKNYEKLLTFEFGSAKYLLNVSLMRVASSVLQRKRENEITKLLNNLKKIKLRVKPKLNI